MEEKKYVYYVTTGVVGVDDRRSVGRFADLAEAIKFMEHRKNLLDDEARIESQQVQYSKTYKFTQFDIQIEKALLDEDDCIVDVDCVIYDSTPKFRYGQIVK